MYVIAAFSGLCKSKNRSTKKIQFRVIKFDREHWVKMQGKRAHKGIAHFNLPVGIKQWRLVDFTCSVGYSSSNKPLCNEITMVLSLSLSLILTIYYTLFLHSRLFQQYRIESERVSSLAVLKLTSKSLIFHLSLICRIKQLAIEAGKTNLKENDKP